MAERSSASGQRALTVRLQITEPGLRSIVQAKNRLRLRVTIGAFGIRCSTKSQSGLTIRPQCAIPELTPGRRLSRLFRSKDGFGTYRSTTTASAWESWPKENISPAGE